MDVYGETRDDQSEVTQVTVYWGDNSFCSCEKGSHFFQCIDGLSNVIQSGRVDDECQHFDGGIQIQQFGTQDSLLQWTTKDLGGHVIWQ